MKVCAEQPHPAFKRYTWYLLWRNVCGLSVTRFMFNTVTRLENICPDYVGAALARGDTLLCTILGRGWGETWQLSGARHRGQGDTGAGHTGQYSHTNISTY